MRKLKDEMKAKNDQIALLEKQIEDSIFSAQHKMDTFDVSQVSFALSLSGWLYISVVFFPSSNMCGIFFELLLPSYSVFKLFSVVDAAVNCRTECTVE